MRRREIIKAGASAAAIGGVSGCIGGGSSGESGDSSSNSGNSNGQARELTFMMSPTDPIEKMRAQYAPIGNYLGEELSGEVSLQYASSYSAINRALGSENGHMAEMGPIAAALGVSEGTADIVLQRRGYGSWEYSSIIITREETDIESIEDLEGKTIAFADILSTSGSIYPLKMMKDAGIEVGSAPKSDSGADFDASWSGHTPAFESLMGGQADAAGVGLFVATKEDSDGYADGVQEVARKDGLPRAPIVVSQQLNSDMKRNFTDAMLNAPSDIYLGEDGEDGTDDDLWFDAVREASVDTYSDEVETAEELGIDIGLLDQETES